MSTLRRALHADIDEEAWSSLDRTTSRPFPAPETVDRREGHQPLRPRCWRWTQLTASPRQAVDSTQSTSQLSSPSWSAWTKGYCD